MRRTALVIHQARSKRDEKNFSSKKDPQKLPERSVGFESNEKHRRRKPRKLALEELLRVGKFNFSSSPATRLSFFLVAGSAPKLVFIGWVSRGSEKHELGYVATRLLTLCHCIVVLEQGEEKTAHQRNDAVEERGVLF